METILLTNLQTFFKCHQLPHEYPFPGPGSIQEHISYLIVLPLQFPLIRDRVNESLSVTDGSDNNDGPLEFLAHL